MVDKTHTPVDTASLNAHNYSKKFKFLYKSGSTLKFNSVDPKLYTMPKKHKTIIGKHRTHQCSFFFESFLENCCLSFIIGRFNQSDFFSSGTKSTGDCFSGIFQHVGSSFQ